MYGALTILPWKIMDHVFAGGPSLRKVLVYAQVVLPLEHDRHTRAARRQHVHALWAGLGVKHADVAAEPRQARWLHARAPLCKQELQRGAIQ